MKETLKAQIPEGNEADGNGGIPNTLLAAQHSEMREVMLDFRQNTS